MCDNRGIVRPRRSPVPGPAIPGPNLAELLALALCSEKEGSLPNLAQKPSVLEYLGFILSVSQARSVTTITDSQADGSSCSFSELIAHLMEAGNTDSGLATQARTETNASEAVISPIDQTIHDKPDNITSAILEDSLPSSAEPFSVFTDGQKRWINWLASFGAMFSTLNSYIYFPAVIPIARDLNISVTLVNLTITCYLVVAGIVPAIMGDLADHEGRRPAYLIMCALTVGANVGLAVQHSYPALFVLRMLQAAGSSGAFGAAHGVVSDISPVAERGSFTGTVILFTNAAPSFGPIISGALAETIGWRWIFWLLTILTATYSVALVLFFPETQRKLVGNGSRRVHGLIYRNLFSTVTSHRHAIDRVTAPSRPRHHIPNPFACLPMLAYKNNLCLVLFSSITYSLRMTLQASLGSQCPGIYNLNYLQAGLIFLPPGVGGTVAAKLQGVLIDRNYKRMCKQLDGPDSEFQRGENISDFPIEKARLRGASVMIVITVAATVGYGVALMTRAVSARFPVSKGPR